MDKRERTGGGRWWIMGNGHASWKSKYGREREREGEGGRGRERETERSAENKSDQIRSDPISSARSIVTIHIKCTVQARGENINEA